VFIPIQPARFTVIQGHYFIWQLLVVTFCGLHIVLM
jgi:hypothetical protein